MSKINVMQAGDRKKGINECWSNKLSMTEETKRTEAKRGEYTPSIPCCED